VWSDSEIPSIERRHGRKNFGSPFLYLLVKAFALKNAFARVRIGKGQLNLIPLPIMIRPPVRVTRIISLCHLERFGRKHRTKAAQYELLRHLMQIGRIAFVEPAAGRTCPFVDLCGDEPILESVPVDYEAPEV
jgi:hypothetical protein